MDYDRRAPPPCNVTFGIKMLDADAPSALIPTREFSSTAPAPGVLHKEETRLGLIDLAKLGSLPKEMFSQS